MRLSRGDYVPTHYGSFKYSVTAKILKSFAKRGDCQ